MSNSNLAEAAKATRQPVEHYLATAAPAQPDDCGDRAFAEAMIAHYEGSIKAARLMQNAGSDVTLRWLADAIIASHQRDLEMLRDWVRSCRNQDAATTHSQDDDPFS